MIQVRNTHIKAVFASFYNSYSQVFFSNKKAFGVILILASFLNIQAGLSGLIAVAVTNLAAYLIGLNKKTIEIGSYAFNSLLTGLGLGLFYDFNIAFLFVLIFASLLTFFFTVLLKGWLGKYSLPYLSFPFLMGTWLVSLASRQFKGLEMSTSGVFKYNEIFLTGGEQLLQAHIWFTNLPIPESLLIYFQSLGAIFFQYTVYAGIVIAIGLLIASRISFFLSLFGFYAAFYYYQIIGADIGELNYGYIGFNYILTAIAIGGFFVIPSIYSYLWVILLTPVLSLFVTGSGAVLQIFQLSAYSLPFNMVVILFLYTLMFRDRNFDKPYLVKVQEFSPEQNLYSYLSFVKRFKQQKDIGISLPVKGKWTINQGHKGKHTHKEEWRHAWDFVVMQDGEEFKNKGTELDDYFCYNQIIYAPADGIIEAIVDGIEDNKVGDVNMKDNWGNSLVIRHSDTVFSQMSHLKMHSFKVHIGQKIKAGDALATLGNSGRSSYPHLHFQLQDYPYIGSKTIEYPFAHYLQSTSLKDNVLKRNQIPKEGDVIENLDIDSSLRKAFNFIPGQQFDWKSEVNELLPSTDHHWEVKSDIFKNTFLECTSTKSRAYFKAFHNEMYFTHFNGSKKSALYYFYLATFRVYFSYKKDMVIEDQLPTQNRPTLILRWIQDLIAPFYRFEKSMYRLQYVKRETFFDESSVELSSEYNKILFGKNRKTISFKHIVNPQGIKEIHIQPPTGKPILLQRIDIRD